MPKVSDKISDEQLERLDLMASGREMTWDLSDNDCEAIASALRELRELRRMNEWVGVYVQKPEFNKRVLISSGTEASIAVGHLVSNEWWKTTHCEVSLNCYEKWRPLPPSPEEAKSE